MELETLTDTERLAARVADWLTGAETIGLVGALGAGKTTFVRALLAALGSTDAITSPSYVLSHEYETARGYRVEHWDLYRVRGALPELLEPEEHGGVRVIEWVDRDSELVACCDLIITFRLRSSGVRDVAFKGPRAEEFTDG